MLVTIINKVKEQWLNLLIQVISEFFFQFVFTYSVHQSMSHDQMQHLWDKYDIPLIRGSAEPNTDDMHIK